MLDADIVYVCVPDYLSAVAVLRIKKFQNIRVILDIVDLWPEAFPFPSLINFSIKWCSKKVVNPLRRFLFQGADLILFQSNHFLKQFGSDQGRYGLLSMCLPDKSLCNKKNNTVPISGVIRILFLGSINSITDINSLAAFLVQLSDHRNVELRVVGGGIGLTKLDNMIHGSSVKLIIHGITFDQNFISKELGLSHFGFNGYKTATEVAVSYKSLDYLQAGLPIINCTKGDLVHIVDEYFCGFNYSPDNIRALVEKVLCLSDEEHGLMKKNARKVFNEKFCFSNFVESLNNHFQEVIQREVLM